MNSEHADAHVPSGTSADAGCELSAEDEQLIDEFDVAWRNDEQPDIDTFLARRPAASSASGRLARNGVLVELVKIDLEYRWRQAHRKSKIRNPKPEMRQGSAPPLIEQYEKRFPSLSLTGQRRIELAAEEYRVRRIWGDLPNKSEYSDRFPEIESELSLSLEQIDGELAADTLPADSPATLDNTDNESLIDATEAFGPGTTGPPRPGNSDVKRPLKTTGAGDEIGRTFGDYVLLEEIARGGMGVVYRARQTTLNRTVALKVILSGELASERDVQRFHTEAESAANLDHPGIVPIYEVGQNEGRHYFSMAFIDGQNLTAAVADGPMLPKRAAKILCQIAEAVHYAHQQGVIHRDLKPANILLDAAGLPKVTDFGLAKQIGDESGLTTTGQVLGTPACMPPEQAEGQLDEIGPKSDVYSLGAVLYTLLTGRPPFGASNPLETLRQVVEQDPVSPRRLNTSVPKDLETICLKCLQKQPEKRYATAELLASDLKRFLRNEPTLARPVSRVTRLWRWCRRKPVIATLGLLAMLLSMLVVVVGWIGYAQTGLALQVVKQEKQEVERQRGRVENALTDAQSARDEERNRAREADEARKKEQQAAQRERGARRDVEAALIDAEISLYFNQISASQREWLANHVSVAEQILNSLPRRLRHWKDIRGWEWDYLNRVCQLERFVLTGHTGVVYAVAVSPDGKRIASAGQDSSVRVWDTESGTLIRVLEGHTSWVRSLCFGPDPGQLSSAGDDNTVRIWNTETGTQLHTLRGHRDRVHSVAFSPDGSRIASAGETGVLKIWLVASGEETSSFRAHDQTVYSASFSPDGKRIATASWDGTAQIFNADAGTAIFTLQGHRGPVYDVAFSPNGRLLATTGKDETVRIWDAETGAETHVLRGHLNSVYCVRFLPDGKHIASAGRDMSIRIWDANTERAVETIRGHTESIYGLAFTPDGTQMVSAGIDATIRIWETLGSGPASVLRQDTQPMISVNSVAFDRTGKLLVSGGNDQTVRLWNIAARQVIATFRGHNDLVTAVSASPADALVASASNDGTVTLYDVESKRRLRSFEGHTDSVRCLAFSPDGKWVASGGDDETIQIWNVYTGQPLTILRGHEGSIRSIEFHPDGRRVLSAGTDGLIRLWNVKDAQAVWSVETTADTVLAVAFHPDGRRFATAGDDGVVRIREMESGEMLLMLRGHAGPVSWVTYSPDGQRIASAGRDGTVRLWDAATGRQALNIPADSGPVRSVTFSPDGRQIASADQRGTIKIFQTVTGRKVERSDPSPPEVNIYRLSR